MLAVGVADEFHESDVSDVSGVGVVGEGGAVCAAQNTELFSATVEVVMVVVVVVVDG